MALATAMPSKNRKRRRRQGTAASTTTSPEASTTTTKLPRVTTAPARLPTHKGSTKLSGRAPPSTPKPFTDNSHLEAQISTLSLVQTHGYGPVPGTPMLRGKASSTNHGAERFRIMGGVRDGAAINGAVGQGNAATASAAGRITARGSSSGGKRPRNLRSRASTSRASIREPWLGPMDSGVGLMKGQHDVSSGKVKGCVDMHVPTYYHIISWLYNSLSAVGSHYLNFTRSYALIRRNFLILGPACLWRCGN